MRKLWILLRPKMTKNDLETLDAVLRHIYIPALRVEVEKIVRDEMDKALQEIMKKVTFGSLVEKG